MPSVDIPVTYAVGRFGRLLEKAPVVLRYVTEASFNNDGEIAWIQFSLGSHETSRVVNQFLGRGSSNASVPVVL